MTFATGVESIYDRIAPIYERLWARYIVRTHDELLSRVRLEDGQRVLDVGCGTGILEERLVSLNPYVEIVGVDPSSRMLVQSEAKFIEKTNVTFIQSSAESLPFEDEAFDLVLSASAMHYFEDPAGALGEMCRVLVAGGRLTVVDWCRESLRMRLADSMLRRLEAVYVRAYTRDEFLEMASREGLLVEAIDTFRVGHYMMMAASARRENLQSSSMSALK